MLSEESWAKYIMIIILYVYEIMIGRKQEIKPVAYISCNF